MPRTIVLLLGCALVLGLALGGTETPAADQPQNLTKPVSAGAKPARPKTGPMHLVFTERSPHSNFDAMTKRGDFKERGYWVAPGSREPTAEKGAAARAEDDAASRAAAAYDIAGESFEAFVPAKPRKDGRYGLFVWIHSGTMGQVVPGWEGVLVRHNLIWIGANNAGNKRPFGIRAALALDAAHNMRARYDIDPQRVYVGGFSGGASCSQMLFRSFPDVFRGVFLLGGGGFVGGRMDESTKTWRSGTHGPKWGEGVDVEDVKANCSMVMMNGTKDGMASVGGGKATAEAMWLDGYRRVTNIDVPGLGHTLPRAEWFERAVKALDAPPAKPAPTTAPTTRPDPGPGQIAYAERLLTDARFYADNGWSKHAERSLRRIIDDYPTTPAAAEARKILGR